MTSNNTFGRRPRIGAGVMLLTAAASVTGLLGAAAPANAAPDAYVVLSVGDVNDAPPVRTVGVAQLDRTPARPTAHHCPTV
jgi:tetrahydromethanopterin S-methyltransferase subunit D